MEGWDRGEVVPHVSRYHADRHPSVVRGEVMPHPLRAATSATRCVVPTRGVCWVRCRPRRQGTAGWSCEVDWWVGVIAGEGVHCIVSQRHVGRIVE